MRLRHSNAIRLSQTLVILAPLVVLVVLAVLVVLVVLVALVVLLALVVPSFPVDLLGKSGTDDVFQTFHNRSTCLGHGEVSENTRGASNT